MKSKQKTRLTYQRGLSLVEILVVIIILVFGVLVIIRVYPSGFLVMRNSANLNRADRLESALLSSMIAAKEVPNAVYFPVGFATVNGDVVPQYTLAADPGLATTVDAGGLNPSGNIVAAAYISEQPFTISAPDVANPPNALPALAGNPMIVLPFGPIVCTTGTAASPGPNDVPGSNDITVVSTNWKAIEATGVAMVPPNGAQLASNFTEAESLVDGEYAIDTSDSAAGYEIAFPVEGYNQTFYINYTVAGVPAPTITLTLPAGTIPYNAVSPNTTPFNPTAANGGYEGYWDTLADIVQEYAGTAGPLSWDLGSLQISRPLAPVGSGGFGGAGTDPYVYEVDPNDTVYTSPSGNINMGVLLFSPQAAPNILQHPLKVLVSYSVYAWGILHEDDALNSSSDTVDLAVSDIKQAGLVQSDQTISTPLFPSGASVNGSVVAMDLDTGQVIPSGDATVLSYEKGQLQLIAGFGSLYPHVRFYYATGDNVELALQKAPASFQPVPASGSEATDLGLLTSASTTTPNYYYIDPTINSNAEADQLQFPLTCAGQTVNLENVTWNDTGGLSHAIANVTINVSGPATSGPDSVTAYADITGILRDAALSAGVTLAAPGSANSFSVGGVGGVSARAVGIWKESGNWKIHNVDTILQ